MSKQTARQLHPVPFHTHICQVILYHQPHVLIHFNIQKNIYLCGQVKKKCRLNPSLSIKLQLK